MKPVLISNQLKMKAEEIKEITTAIKGHIVMALTWLYEAAQNGDNRMELGCHTVEYSNGDYTIIAIDMEYSENKSGELVYYQLEGNDEQEDWQRIEFLSLETLCNLLASVEKKLNGHYDRPLTLTKTVTL